MAAYESEWLWLADAVLRVALHYEPEAFRARPFNADTIAHLLMAQRTLLEQFEKDQQQRDEELRHAAKSDARVAICDAIADEKLRLRFFVERTTGARSKPKSVAGSVRYGHEVLIPPTLDPGYFDWSNSRPVVPLTPKEALNAAWHVSWMQVSRADVDDVLCAEPVVGNTAQQKSVAAAKPPPKQRTSPALERAKAAIAALYPNGVPDQVALPNVTLYRAVGEKLKAEGKAPVSDDTISRAAARRRK